MRLIKDKTKNQPHKVPQIAGIWTSLGYFIMQGEVYRWEGHGWISNQMREYYDIPELNVEEYDFKEPRFADFLKSYPQFPGILEKSRSARWVIKKPQFSDSASVSKEKRKKMFADLFSVLLYNSKNE